MAKKAGMSTGVEVARITVKVSPNTHQFRRELQDQLNDIEKKEKVELSPDDKDFNKKVKKTVKESTSEVNKGGTTKIKLDTDSSSIDRSIKAMQAGIQKLDLKWDKKVMAFRLENFKPQADFAQARLETNRIVQEYEIAMDKVRRSNDNLELALRPNLSRFDPRKLRATFRNWFGGKPVEIPVTFGEDGGGGGGAGGLGKKAGKFPFPSFGSGINPAGWAAILAGVLVVAGPLVGLITTALAALPGLIALIGLPIAAITLGLDGFKKAAEKIKPQFEDLKNVMSQASETAFSPVLQSLADTIFPLLKESLPAVTQGLAQFAQGAIDAFKDPGNAARFQNSITRIGQAFNDMRPGLDGFVSGFIGLIDQFTMKLPDITAWFNKTGQDFANWVKEMSTIDPSTGVSKMSTAFDQLGKFIRTVLDFLGELAGKSMDFMGNTGSIDGFTRSMKTLGDAIQGVITLSETLNEKWQGLVQVARGLGFVQDILSGDLVGAFNNGKDLVTNKPWQDLASSVDDVKTSADAAKESLLGMGGAAAGSPVPAAVPSLIGSGVTGEPAKVEVPDVEPAKAELTEYQGFVDSVTQQVRGSLSAATSGESLPAPNFDAFKAAWNSIPTTVNDAVRQVGEATTNMATVVETGAQSAVSAMEGLPAKMKAPLEGLSGQMMQVGADICAGLAAGIANNQSQAIAAAANMAASALAAAKAALDSESPSKKFIELGKDTGAGMAIGIDKGFGPVLDQAREMAGKVSEAFANGSDPTGSLAGFTDTDIKRMEKVLGLEIKRLEIQAKALDYQAKTTGNDALKARADELRLQKDQFSMQKDMLGLTRDYNDEAGGSGEDPFVKAASGLMNAPVDFAKATGQQFLSDIGISGDGLISKAITEGISYVFNIGSVDEALSIKDRQDSKQAMSITGR